jgi:hypothetical protein
MQIKAGVEVLQRGEFVEIADAELDRYLNGLVSARNRRSSSAKLNADEG